MQQQAAHKQALATLRSLRAQLIAQLSPTEETLEACRIRTQPNVETEPIEIYSSDDEQLYSRQALKEKQAFAQGIGETLQGRIDGL